ncbi:MAG: ATP-binding cassette domain-containing protein [Coriobacteriales bacterium]
MALFALEHLSFAYPGATTRALDDVSVEVGRGEYLCVCGKSGCGKTTLLRQLKSVLAPHGTRSGAVLLDSMALDEVPLATQARRIGFVMQDPDAQIVTDRVWHELAFGLESTGCEESALRLRVAEMASYFGIGDWFHRDVSELSGGQKQLLNLAGIMAMQPDVLVCDEPTSQLDPVATTTFLDTVRHINRDLGVTVIMSEHRLEEVFACADHVLVLDEGRVTAQGTSREVAAALHAAGDAMTFALPSPVRVYYGVEGVDDRMPGPYEGKEPRGGAVAQTVLSSHGSATGASGSCGTRFVHPPLGSSTRFSQSANHLDKCACPLTVREGRKWLVERVLADPPARVAMADEGYGMDGREVAVEMRDVWFRYERTAPDVLRGADLRVPSGSLFAIVGGNGSGKSTLLKCLCGVARPQRGMLRVLGHDIKGRGSNDPAHGDVAMLPQDPANLFSKGSVREELAEMATREERIAAVARDCGIERLLDAHPLDLSGGEQQRVALAKVLLTEPRLLLLDEPTKGIDAFFKRSMAALLRTLAERGVTVVMVSHDVEFCARHADLVALLFDGAIVTTATPRRLFSDSAFYTTAANRMSRSVFAGAITDEDVIELCLG